MEARWIETVGLVLSATSALLLFRFGLPFGQRTGGAEVLATGNVDAAELHCERAADLIGWIAIVMGTLGVGFQVVVTWLTP